MFINDRIQKTILALEGARGARIMWTLAAVLALAGLMVWYDLGSYHSLSAPDAMQGAEVGRNLAEGRGYTTRCVTPFRLFLEQQRAGSARLAPDRPRQAGGFYPDESDPPVYPLALAGLFKWTHPRWEMNSPKSFWMDNGRFQRYQPEFEIAIFNQLLLLLAVGLTYGLARSWFDRTAAWLAALATLGSAELWRFSVSGLSTLLLLVIFLTLTWCLTRIESLARAETPAGRRLPALALAAGALAGLGLLTRYGFGWVLAPVLVFLIGFGGPGGRKLAGLAAAMFVVVVAPWLVRNEWVGGAWFGRAGYAVLEGTALFPGATLLQTSSPAMAGALLHGGWISLVAHKLGHDALDIFQNDLPRLGGWAAALFFGGLLLRFRNPAPGRLRWFVLMCLGVWLPVQALDRTWLSDLTPQINSENLLVLLTPLAVIFGIAFFLTLLDQLAPDQPETRYAAMSLLMVVLCLPFLAGLLAPRQRTVAYPPYYPPEIQRVSQWLGPEELMMSDVPWAVAWYGRHACVSLTRDTREDFADVNDYFMPVKGVYLSPLTLDDKFFTQVLRADPHGWNRLVLNFMIKDAVDQALAAHPGDELSALHVVSAPPVDYLGGFPLRTAKSLDAGLFFTDRVRWP